MFINAHETAGDIVALLSEMPDFQREKTISAIFLDRWVPGPGWSATVTLVPVKMADGSWFVILRELESNVTIHALAIADMGQLRPDELVRVSGQITKINRSIWDKLQIRLKESKIEPIPKPIRSPSQAKRPPIGPAETALRRRALSTPTRTAD